LPKGTEKGKAPMNSGKGRAMDFSTVKPFDPLPEKDEDTGKMIIYPARIFKITTDKKGPKGAYDEVVFEITGPDKYKRRQLFRNYSVTESALPFYHELLKSANPEVELGSDFIMTPEEWIGLEVGLSIENESYEEQIRSRVKRVYPASKVTVK